MNINRLPPRPPPPPPPPPKVAPRANAPAPRAQPPVLPSKDTFQRASALSTRPAAPPVNQAAAPVSAARGFAGVQAQGTVRTEPAGFFENLGHGIQDLGHGIQDLAHDTVEGATDLAHDVAHGATDLFNGAVEGARDLAQGTADAVQQGLDVLDTAVTGTGNYAPEPAPGFGTTPPGTPMPPGARPVQGPQPTDVPGVSKDPDDGWIVGAGPTGPTAYPPNTPPDQVKPFTPEGQEPNAPRPTVFFTNGILTNSADQAKAAQQLANQTGANVVCVHNGTGGFVPDVAQAGGDRLSLPGNAATNTLTNLMTQAARSGQPVHVAAHSQGGIITSDALQQTKDNLRAQGMSATQVERTMGNFQVETFGGAAASYPSGPRYTHVIHPGDPVSGPLGMGQPANAARALASGQRVVVAPNPGPIYGDPFQNHGFSGYVPQARLP
ncbi:hypothetical protein [Cystobacter fuscus]|uniref:hypothetical protein n=1 Tax=Cystobacter fuscus TaxID=43 RepID=UPI002B300426|nr:hypothetical protein F0U63_33250 [Cystobacter fuscus]